MKLALKALGTLLLVGSSAFAGPGDVGSVGTFGRIPVTRQVDGRLDRTSQLVTLRAENVELGKSRNDLPQIELTVSGFVSTHSSEVTGVVATPQLIGRDLGKDQILKNSLSIDFAGLQKIEINAIHILDGSRPPQSFNHFFRTKIVIEMEPTYEELVLAKKIAGRMYELHFPASLALGSEIILTVLYDGKQVTMLRKK